MVMNEKVKQHLNFRALDISFTIKLLVRFQLSFKPFRNQSHLIIFSKAPSLDSTMRPRPTGLAVGPMSILTLRESLTDMTGTKIASAVEHRSALSGTDDGYRTSILMIDAKYGFNISPGPSDPGNRRLLVRRAIASVLCSRFRYSNNVHRARSNNVHRARSNNVHRARPNNVHRARYANLTGYFNYRAPQVNPRVKRSSFMSGITLNQALKLTLLWNIP